MNIVNKTKGKFTGRIILINIIITVLIVILPSFKIKPKEKSEDELWKKALKICKKNVILDSHIDWPDKHLFFPEDISKKTTKGDFDL
ncbi:MAG: hypothetical protein JW702_07105, partial [Clostridiales bacterium]|nr:hypothetical protein [Clostridiales bacterium]